MRQRPQAAQAARAAKALVQYRSEATEAQNQPGELKAAKAKAPPSTPERPTGRPPSASPKPKATGGGERSPPSPKPKAEAARPPSPRPKADAKAKPSSAGSRPATRSAPKPREEAESPPRAQSAESRSPAPASQAKAKAKAATPDSRRGQLAPPPAKAKAASREASPQQRSPAKAAPDAKVASPAKAKVPSPSTRSDAAAKSKAAAQSPRSPPAAKAKAAADATPRVAKAKPAVPPAPRQKEKAAPARPKESIGPPKTGGERKVRVTSRLSTDSQGPAEAAASSDAPEADAEGETGELAEEEVHAEASGRMRPPRKRDSQGMVTLREGELESISSIVPTGPEEELEEGVPPPQEDDAVAESEKDPSAQPWQNRWRRQSSPQAEGESPEAMASESLRPSGMVKFKTQSEHEDEQASMSRRDSMDSADRAFAPVVSERSRMSHASHTSVASDELQGPESRRASKELASEGKLVSLHGGGEADIPLLPAPVTVESRRRTVVAREIQPPPPPTETIRTPPEAPSEQPVRRPSQEKMPAAQAVQEKPPEERATLPEPTDSSTAFENIQVPKEERPPPELPKQLPLSEDRPSDRPRSKSRNSVPEAAQRPIRADGLQELLQEVYDKFRTCSAHLRQTGSRQVVSPTGEPVAGSEDTDLADTWQEVEWLRQAVVGMHSHLLLAQKRQHALEKKCKDFQDRISEVRNGVSAGDMDDTAAIVSTPMDVRRRKQELLVPQQEPTLTTSTVASYDSLQRRPQQYLQVPSQVVTPVSTALQGSGLRWAESPRTAASTPQLSARTRVIYDQSTLPRPHEVQTVLATPPRQLRSPAAVYATPLLPGQATPPQPQRGRLLETAPVYARQEISATPPQPHPYVRTAVSATPPRGRSEAKWVRSEAMSTLVPALAANPMDVLSRSLTPNRSAPMSLPMQVEPLTSPRAVSASPAKGVRAWLSPSAQSTGASTGLLYGSGSISTFAQQCSPARDWVPALPPPPPLVNMQPRFAMPANPFLSQSLP